MVASQEKKGWGFSLVETAIAIVIIAIVALGALSYQYFGVKHLKIARANFAATRIGQLLLEDWKGTGAASPYNPTTLGLGFTKDNASNSYVVTIDGITFYIPSPLVSSVVATNTYAGTLRQISVTVRWRSDFSAGAPRATDPSLVFTTYSR